MNAVRIGRPRKRRRPEDPLDELAERWGRDRRWTLGLAVFDVIPVSQVSYRTEELLGKLRSTLGSVTVDRVAAGSGTAIAQHFPEVYTGETLLIHRAWREMEGRNRMVYEAHFVWSMLPVAVKSLEIGIPEATYWQRLGLARAFVAGFLTKAPDIYIEKNAVDSL